MGVATGLAGIAMGVWAMRRAGAGGAGVSERQTPKRDFADRMKAGLAEGEAPGEGGSSARDPAPKR